ncbi:hypothetical protein QBC41DRAFT_382846 [Cercophora samala]|uniref:Uncharacterized protein n=1 Tax=Cercophora samala TaxID=330535 RepID=A0AA39YZV8_9PEZI|nr:hypothetical protein QBC41DRAFT_382846 [Cercophora samala]
MSPNNLYHVMGGVVVVDDDISTAISTMSRRTEIKFEPGSEAALEHLEALIDSFQKGEETVLESIEREETILESIEHDEEPGSQAIEAGRDGERAPMKRSFDKMEEIPKYEGARPKLLVFDASALMENRAGICHSVHKVFATLFPKYKMPTQDEIMEAYSFTGSWPDILAHLGISKKDYRANKKASEKLYMQAYLEINGPEQMCYFSDSVRVLRAAKKEGFVLAIMSVDSGMIVDAMVRLGTIDIFDIYIDNDCAWISRGVEAPPRPVETKDIIEAYDEYLKDKGLKVEGKHFHTPTGDDSNKLKRDEFMIIEGTVKQLESHRQKVQYPEIWSYNLVYVARTEADLSVELESWCDLAVEDLDEFGYAVFGLPLPDTAPARPAPADRPTVIEIEDGENDGEDQQMNDAGEQQESGAGEQQESVAEEQQKSGAEEEREETGPEEQQENEKGLV